MMVVVLVLVLVLVQVLVLVLVPALVQVLVLVLVLALAFGTGRRGDLLASCPVRPKMCTQCDVCGLVSYIPIKMHAVFFCTDRGALGPPKRVPPRSGADPSGNRATQRSTVRRDCFKQSCPW